ncbi:MAG: tetratricopeptide repeat protein [Clostridiales bacterium]|nr:tetratricopeptide repeat protein [Clostridiales bacterium]
MNKRINWPRYWKFFTLGFLMLSWIVLVFIMNKPEWTLIPAFIIYLLINALIFRSYTQGVIGNYWYTIKHFTKAYGYFEKAVNSGTHHVKALYLHALKLLQDGKGEEALKYFERAEKYNFNVLMEKYITVSKSSCYWIMGDIDKAISLLEGLMKKFSYISTDAYTTLGYLYYLKDDLEKAELYTNKAIEDNDEHSPAWDNLGQIYYKKGEVQKAKEYFEKAISFKDIVDSLYFMGRISEDEGNIKEAEEYYERALKCNISALNTVTEEEIKNRLTALRRKI